MKKILFVFLGLCLLSPLIGRAEICAWLNAATAGGLIGGEVTYKVTHTSPEDTTCVFTRNSGASVSTLQISVNTMTEHEKEFPGFLVLCGATATPIRAVGNEAVECTQSIDPGRVTEQIVARVRERAFVLRWTMPTPNADASIPAPGEVQERLRNVAEQVAGSLF
jgi:hypothetical protein